MVTSGSSAIVADNDVSNFYMGVAATPFVLMEGILKASGATCTVRFF